MRLCNGLGSYENNEACLMSAAAYYAGENTAKFWTDRPSCVAPEIITIGIALNDACRSFEEREELCGDLVFLVLGTRTDDPKVNAERLRILRVFTFDRAIEALDCAKVKRNLLPFSEYSDSHAAARAAAHAAHAAHAAARAATDAAHTVAAHAAHARAAADAAANADANAGAAAGTGINARRLRRLRQLMLDLIAVGERKEIVPVLSKQELIAWCNGD